MVFRTSVHLTYPPARAAQSFVTQPAHPAQLEAFFNTIYYARFKRRPAPPGHNNSSGLATNTDE